MKHTPPYDAHDDQSGRDHLIERLESFLEGELPAGDPIEREIREDPSVREIYQRLALERAALHEALRLHAEEQSAAPAVTARARRSGRIPARTRPERLPFYFWIVPAAAVFAVAAGLYLLLSQEASHSTSLPAPQEDIVAKRDSRREVPTRDQTLDQPAPSQTTETEVQEPPITPETIEIAEAPGIQDVPGAPEQPVAAVTAPSTSDSRTVETVDETPSVPDTTELAGRVVEAGSGMYRQVGDHRQDLARGRWVVFHDLIGTKNESGIISVNHSSKIVLDRRTELRFIRLENGSMSAELLGGRIFVEWDPGRGPFSVHTEIGRVAVLGTSFSVERRAGYDRVITETGRVRVELEDAGTELTEGKGASLFRGGTIRSFDARRSDLAWAHRLLALPASENTPIGFEKGVVRGKGAWVLPVDADGEEEWERTATDANMIILGRQGEYVRLRLSGGAGLRYLWVRARNDAEWGRGVSAGVVTINGKKAGDIVLPGGGRDWLWYRFPYSSSGVDTVKVIATRDALIDPNWKLPDGSPGYRVALRLDCLLVSGDPAFRPQEPPGKIIPAE